MPGGKPGGGGEGGGGGGGGEGGGGSEGGSEGGGIGGKIGCGSPTATASSSRPSESDTAEATAPRDNLVSESSFASTTSPCAVTESAAVALTKVLVTFTFSATSCGTTVISSELLLSGRVNAAVWVLSSARRRRSELETILPVHSG